MAGVVMSLVMSTVVAGFAWLFLGARVSVSRDAEQNNILNFFFYLLLTLPFAIALVFLACSEPAY